jgi:Ca2+-binding EF-hand superfamily protein
MDGMSLRRLDLLLLACTAALLTAACHAPPPPAPVAPTSEPSPEAGYAVPDLDRDGDGEVSLPELREAAARKFNDLDRDRSGTIDLKHECKPRFASFCKKADLNGDGRIDRAEFLRQAEADFRQADRDGNGRLTRQELTGVTILRW